MQKIKFKVKIISSAIIFILVIKGNSEVVEPMMSYYNNTYYDNWANIALLLGNVLYAVSCEFCRNMI